MKRLSKLLVLVLSLALIVGTIFAVSASAADESVWTSVDLSETVTGATRQHRDFTGESFDVHNYVDGVNEADPKTTKAPEEIWSTTTKIGHFRSVTDTTGNTYYEYAIRTDIDDESTGGRDVVIGAHTKSSVKVNNLSYATFEFDMMTPTDFPANFNILTETRFYKESTEYKFGTSTSRIRKTFATYDKANGEWKVGSNTFALKSGEWAHVTIVFQINKTTTETGVNYKDSVAKIYVNGEYMSTLTGIFPNKEAPADVDARIYYCGVGFAYGTVIKGTKADDAIGLDNIVYTTYTDAYVSEENVAKANLTALFSANPTTNIADLGPEIVWGKDYKLPAKSSDVLVIDADETAYGAEDGVTSLKDALAFIKENEMEGATIKLFSNQYNPLTIDFPVEITIDYNGYKLQNGFAISDNLSAEIDADTNTITVSSDPTKLVTVNYYDLPKGEATTSAFVQQIALGRTIVYRTNEVLAQSLISGNKAYAPLATYKVYDGEGNEVTEIPETVTEEMLGKTYFVYFDYEVKEFEGNITFSVALDGEVTYYTSNDLWAAGVTPAIVKGEVTETTGDDGVVTKSWTETQYPKAIPNGATIILYADCTVSTPLYANSGNFYVDLNGYTLTTAKQFVAANAKYTKTPYTQSGEEEAVAGTVSKETFIKNNQVYFYSSAEGAEMVTTDKVIYASAGIGSSNGVSYYFGYKTSNTASEYRIKITFGDQILDLAKGDLRYVYFRNVDLYNTKYVADGLIEARQCRGLDVTFTDVNIFTISPLTGSTGDSGAKTINFVRTNVYAEGGIKMNYVNPTPNSKGDYASGNTVYNLTDSKIYGMSYGTTAGDAEAGTNDKAFLIVKIKDKTSRISDTHETYVELSGVEGAIVAKPETVTVNGVIYSTVYGVGTGLESTAKFEIYNVPFSAYTEDMIPFETQNVVAGYWFATIAKVEGETVYDYATDAYYAYTPYKYSAYDAQGNVLPAGASVAGETYKVFVEYTKTAVAFAVIDAEGNATPYYDNNLSLVTVPVGSTVVLLSDCYVTGTLDSKGSRVGFTWENVKLDLNGKTLYHTEKVSTFSTAANSSIFIYSSAEGAKYYQAKASGSNCGYVAQVNATNSNFYFGYQDADTVSPYRITVYCGAFSELKSANSNLYLANLDIYKISGDNYGFLNFRGGSSADRNYYVDNCNIYVNSGNVVALRENSNNGEITFRNTTIYSKVASGFVTWQKDTTTTPQLVINFENVAIYGAMASIGTVPTVTELTVNVAGTFTSSFSSDKFVFEEGKTLLPYGTTQTLAGHVACKDGVYGAVDTVYFKGEYPSKYTIGTPDQFAACVLQNMTLDTNVVVNLYVPAHSGITSAKIGDVEILDPNKTEVIGGTTYYVLSYGAAPKKGDAAATVVVTLSDGSTYEFELSVARYAKALQSVEAEEGSYVADAQNLMKYILTYIKEVAVKYGGADEETIFAELGDFSVDTEVTMTETVYDLSAINAYVTHAALDLDSYAGFAFKVAQGFVGTIKLELAGIPAVEYTYTEEAAAGATEVIVLENVPAHIFRGDVVITVTTADGETVEASFNLATYAATYDEAYVKALYAYSLAAKEYNAKYPTVGTAN